MRCTDLRSVANGIAGAAEARRSLSGNAILARAGRFARNRPAELTREQPSRIGRPDGRFDEKH